MTGDTKAAIPIGEVRKAVDEPHRCYDCGEPLLKFEDIFMARRQTSGGAHNEIRVMDNDFEDVPVHADRRMCKRPR